MLDSVARAIDAARAADIPVIYVRVDFRPGFPEVSPHNRAFSQVVGSGFLGEKARLHPAVTPQPEDVEVTKRRVSAFTGSDLEVVLRSREITTLVLTGIATSGVVLSTLREAADKDYEPGRAIGLLRRRRPGGPPRAAREGVPAPSRRARRRELGALAQRLTPRPPNALSSAASRSSHCAPTCAIHETASDRGAGVTR